MTNKYIYFIANWKMYGDLKSLKSLKKVIRFIKTTKLKKFKIIYCPPFTLLNSFVKKFKKTNISIGAQNCHYEETYGPFTGSISSKMIKTIGCKYVIIGHSESRDQGDTDIIINKKIRSSLKNKINIIFCFGETLKDRNKKLTKKIIKKQLSKALNKIQKKQNIFFAYEPVWAIGTGFIPKLNELISNINYIKKLLKISYKIKSPKVLYGGSVSSKNIGDLKKINLLDGFLIGGSSQKANKFIDIIKKTFI